MLKNQHIPSNWISESFRPANFPNVLSSIMIIILAMSILSMTDEVCRYEILCTSRLWPRWLVMYPSFNRVEDLFGIYEPYFIKYQSPRFVWYIWLIFYWVYKSKTCLVFSLCIIVFVCQILLRILYFITFTVSRLFPIMILGLQW